MSVCVSQALNSGIHMHMASMSMMPLHTMAPTSTMLSNSLSNMEMQHSHQLQLQQQNNILDPNEPNPDMLLALIARNKTLEGT